MQIIILFDIHKHRPIKKGEKLLKNFSPFELYNFSYLVAVAPSPVQSLTSGHEA